jgi:hypothetical protein
MSINPILDLLYDGQGELKIRITDRDLKEFNDNHVEPKSALVREIHRQPRHNPDHPARADSRNILSHLWNDHLSGYTPFGDLTFLNDSECDYIHFPILHQVYKYLSTSKTSIYTNNTKDNRTEVSFCIQNRDFLKMALLYEVLPYVGQRLKLSISSEEFRQKIKNTFESFQQKVKPFNQPNSQYDTGIFALGCMNKVVFGRAAVTALDGSCFYPTFQFGSNNDGDAVKAVELLEGMFRSLINQVPLETVQKTPDDTIKYLEYGGSDLSSADAKIDLFCAGVEATRIVRQIVATQHQLMYSDNEFSREIAEHSNKYFDPVKLLAFLANTTQNG